MKRIPCIAIACLILTLSGCAVKSAANAETVCDPGSGPEPPQFCLTAELPAELQRSAEDSAEGRSVYTRADGAYEVVIETAAGAPDAVLRQLTGREAAALDPVYLAWPQADQYQFAWTGADDEGELACCGTLLYDETQDAHAGASGCGCSAAVLCCRLLHSDHPLRGRAGEDLSCRVCPHSGAHKADGRCMTGLRNFFACVFPAFAV